MLNIDQVCKIDQYFRINSANKQVKHVLILPARLGIWKPEFPVQILENGLNPLSQFRGLVMLQAEKLSSHISD